MWANANTNSHVGWQSISDGNSYVYAHPDGSGYSYAYRAGYGYTYSHGVASAHRIHIHIGGQERIVPGTTDIGNHCDDCTTVISLPFSLTLYDQTFTSSHRSSNGISPLGPTITPLAAFACPSLPLLPDDPFYRDDLRIWWEDAAGVASSQLDKWHRS